MLAVHRHDRPARLPAGVGIADPLGELLQQEGAALAVGARLVGQGIEQRLHQSPIRVHSEQAEPEAAAELQDGAAVPSPRSEEHTSELQSLMRISYAVFCLKKKNRKKG